jgi:hypothetical protein
MDHFAAAAGTPSPREEREAGDLSLSAVRGICRRSATICSCYERRPQGRRAVVLRALFPPLTRARGGTRSLETNACYHARIGACQGPSSWSIGLMRSSSGSTPRALRRSSAARPRARLAVRGATRRRGAQRFQREPHPPLRQQPEDAVHGRGAHPYQMRPPAQTLAVLKRRHPRSATRFGAQLGQHPGVDLVGLDTSGATSWTLRA